MLNIDLLLIAGSSGRFTLTSDGSASSRVVEETVISGGERIITSGGERIITSGGERIVTSSSSGVISSGGSKIISSGGSEIISSGGSEIISSGGGKLGIGLIFIQTFILFFSIAVDYYLNYFKYALFIV